ncbi:hypothetical protein A2U01_0062444, partial [Trifolium medium]|nr:hypothetical protein [Trifolium medium]
MLVLSRNRNQPQIINPSSVETSPAEAAPSGDGQRDKEKTIAET